MLEEGKEWDVHVRTRAHRNRVGRDDHMKKIQVKREEARARKEEKERQLASEQPGSVVEA